MNPKQVTGNSDVSNSNVGIVVAKWYPELTQELLGGALKVLERKGFNEQQIVVAHCPGTYEIPFTARQLVEKVDGVITLGVVIRGETSHYDYVCEAVNQGVLELNLRSGKPVSFGVLTTETMQQARIRCGLEGSKGNKGEEASLALVEVLSLANQIQEL